MVATRCPSTAPTGNSWTTRCCPSWRRCPCSRGSKIHQATRGAQHLNQRVPGIGSGARNSLQTDDVWSTTNSLNWTRGAHNVITGFEISRTYTTRFAANNPRGQITFNGSMTGDAAADFMRGIVLSDTTPTVQLGSSGLQWKHAYFVLDKWNATRNLSLNIGLRYELPMVGSSPSGVGNALNREGTALVPETQTPNAKFTLPDH